jgi:hypothetical protein
MTATTEKRAALKVSRALNPRPEAVVDEGFATSSFPFVIPGFAARPGEVRRQ